jgi:hypothetical protein
MSTGQNRRVYRSYDRGLLGGSYAIPFRRKFKKNTTSVLPVLMDTNLMYDILKEERISIRTKFNWNTQLLQNAFNTLVLEVARYYNEWYKGVLMVYEDFPDQGRVNCLVPFKAMIRTVY